MEKHRGDPGDEEDGQGVREEGDEVGEHAGGEGDDQGAPLAVHVAYPPVHGASQKLQDREDGLEVTEHDGVRPQGLGEVGQGAGLDPVAGGVEEDVDVGDQSHPARIAPAHFLFLLFSLAYFLLFGSPEMFNLVKLFFQFIIIYSCFVNCTLNCHYIISQ